MRISLTIFAVLVAGGALVACDIERKPLDPNLMLPPNERQQSGPGLFTGEEGEWTIDID